MYLILPAHNFETISEFKFSIECNAEMQFIWKEVAYTITFPQGRHNISEANRAETEKWCDTVDDILDYIVGGDRLRDVITQVQVTSRTM